MAYPRVKPAGRLDISVPRAECEDAIPHNAAELPADQNLEG